MREKPHGIIEGAHPGLDHGTTTTNEKDNGTKDGNGTDNTKGGPHPDHVRDALMIRVREWAMMSVELS